MTAVAGLRATGDYGSDERPKNFREMIMFRNPQGTSPIFALTSRAKKRTVDDPEFSWWDEPNGNVRLEVNGEVSSSGTLITVQLRWLRLTWVIENARGRKASSRGSN